MTASPRPDTTSPRVAVRFTRGLERDGMVIGRSESMIAFLSARRKFGGARRAHAPRSRTSNPAAICGGPARGRGKPLGPAGRHRNAAMVDDMRGAPGVDGQSPSATIPLMSAPLRLPAIEAPTLLVRGEHSPVLPTPMAEQMKRLIRGARLVEN